MSETTFFALVVIGLNLLPLTILPLTKWKVWCQNVLPKNALSKPLLSTKKGSEWKKFASFYKKKEIENLIL